MKRLYNIKKTRRYRKLKDVLSKIDGLTIGVAKYNEGYNRFDGKKSKIKCGMESDDVIQVLDTEGNIYMDSYVRDFNRKEFNRVCNTIGREYKTSPDTSTT